MTTIIGLPATRIALRREIERELAEFFTQQQATAEAYGGAFTELWALAAEHVLGGKLVRPLLLVESYDAMVRAAAAPGGLTGRGSRTAAPSPSEDSELPEAQPDRATVLRLAAAIELLHYSFLLHDDVIDGDVVRRGKPNLIGVLRGGGGAENARGAAPGTEHDRALAHWARSGGILMGDLLLSATHQMFARAELPADRRGALLDLLEHTIMESVAGEQVDVGLCDGVITPDLHTVLAMSAHKTATYTFELPLRAAAILAGAPPHLERALTSAGAHLGLAFQLQDDLLSVFGDADLHGKDAFSDLREGKQTAIICYARMTSMWPSIENEFGDPDLTTAQAHRLRTLLAECGAERFVRGLVDEQASALYEVLAGTGSPHPIPPEVRRVLLSFAAELEERRS